MELGESLTQKDHKTELEDIGLGESFSSRKLEDPRGRKHLRMFSTRQLCRM